VTRPTVTATTERLYERLPEVYRVGDLAQTTGPDGYPLLRYLSLMGDVLGGLEVLLDRLDDTEEHPSDLLSATGADAGWLRWLGQLVGVAMPPGLSEEAQREAVATASAGWRAGTSVALEAAARRALRGTRYVRVERHVTPAGPGSVWDVTLRVRTSEAESLDAVARAVVDLGAKPAGVRLWVHPFSTPWAVLEAGLPTWADWDGLTWQEIEEFGAGAVEVRLPEPVANLEGRETEQGGVVRLDWVRDPDVPLVEVRRAPLGSTAPPQALSAGVLVARLGRGTDYVTESLLGGPIYAYSVFAISSSNLVSAARSVLVTTTPSLTGAGEYGAGEYGAGEYGG
jgi:hypothetical protein